jgi:hypothetical protein
MAPEFRSPNSGWWRTVGPTLRESEEYQAWTRAYPDAESTLAALPLRVWSVVVFGTGSQNTRVDARTQEEAERLAIEGFHSGDLTFDDTAWGCMDADAEPDPGSLCA